MRSAAPASPAQREAFGVYIHWPFCAQKCPYCDFNSHVRHGGVDEARFVAAFLAELAHARALTGPREVESIFFGGGTPSLMAPGTVGGILDQIARMWTINANAEITLEANPGSVEAGRFRGYAAAGVNRASLGVQSLNDEVLRSLGRIHSVADAKAAIAIARGAFSRVSFDLIYAHPKQTEAAWRSELAEALALAEGHLSLYQLTIEPHTPFAALHAAGKLVPPDPDAALALYDITQELTAAAGLPAYEISNHAVPGEESRHNLLYWRYGEYAGCGPGAHGRLVTDGARHATSAERNPEAWLGLVESAGNGLIEQIVLARSEEADEMLLMGLRLSEGVDLARLAARSGTALSPAAVAELCDLGFVEVISSAGKEPRIRATAKGRFVLNEIVLRLSLGLGNGDPTHSPMDMAALAD
jgi:putative oxygen-independent coproporphyrinogen III oxidase